MPLPGGITSTFSNVHDQLHRHHRIHLGRIAAAVGDRVAQAGQVHQRGLAEDVVAHHACGKPREIPLPLALDKLLQRLGEDRRVAAAHQVLGQHARGVGQRVVGTGLDRIHGGARIEVVQRRTGKRLAMEAFDGHRKSLGKTLGVPRAKTGPEMPHGRAAAGELRRGGPGLTAGKSSPLIVVPHALPLKGFPLDEGARRLREYVATDPKGE